MVKVTAMICATTMAIALASAVAAKAPVLYVDGEPKWGCPLSELGATYYASARELASACQVSLTWLAKSQTLVFARGPEAAALRVNSPVCDTATSLDEIDGPPVVLKGTAMVPVWSMRTMFGMDMAEIGDVLLIVTRSEQDPPQRDENALLIGRYRDAKPVAPDPELLATLLVPSPAPTMSSPASAAEPASVTASRPVTKVGSPSAHVVRHAVTNEGGNFFISGEVKNDTSKQLAYVEVDFSILDASGAQVDTCMTNTTNLAPLGVWKFQTYIFHPETMATYRLTEVVAH